MANVSIIEEIVVADVSIVEEIAFGGAAIIEAVEFLGYPGEKGDPGESGESFSFEHVQASPLATWTIAVPDAFGRRPNVAVFLSTGEQVIADVVCSPTNVSISFASPVAGSAVLS